MFNLFRSRFVLALFVFFLHHQISHAQWSVTILHPTGAVTSTGNAISGSTQGGAVTFNSGDPQHAVVWSGNAASYVDLHQASWTLGSTVNGVLGNTSVGYSTVTQGAERAVLWTNQTAASAVDLHPSSGYDYSVARAVSGNSQVGYGGIPIPGSPGSNFDHALLWSGTAASVVDLHPTGADGYSIAFGVFGNQQVGVVDNYNLPNDTDRATLWSGTAASAVDLHPLSGYDYSTAYSLDANSQVGWAQISSSPVNHAMLWSGTAASAVDLNPAGYFFSAAYDVAGNIQVGEGAGPLDGGYSHAMLWNGSAGSFVDLHSFLPSGFLQSAAYGIDPVTGNIIGVAYNTNVGVNSIAVMWTPIPEPSTVILGGLAAIGLIVTVRRKCKV